MARRFLLVVPGLASFALFTACGGAADSDLFSPSGGASFAGQTGKGGASSSAGANHSASGASSRAGSSAGGAANAGSSSTAGADSGEAGGSSAGAANGGTAGSGTSGSTGTAGSGGTTTAGGNGGATSMGGNAGTGVGGAATGGSGGAIGDFTCEQLRNLATKQLAAARACNAAMSAPQCTGKVPDVCGCQVPVRFPESAETKAYLQTQKQIEKKNCQLFCLDLLCPPVGSALCKPSSASGDDGVCTVNFIAL